MTDDAIPAGTFACPICGNDTPHYHSPEEVEQHRETEAWVEESWQQARPLFFPDTPTPSIVTGSDERAREGRFWLIVHEPGNVPDRKGSWPRAELPKVMREFIAARRNAYLTVLTVGADGTPDVQHGPEALQMADGRSMSVGSKHNARTKVAHSAALAASRPTEAGAGEMTREERRFEDLKQMAAYTGPVVSFDFREPFYLASCDHCGWVGSSEACGSDEADDVFCPRCQASGADCGKVAAALATPKPPVDEAMREAQTAAFVGAADYVERFEQALSSQKDDPSASLTYLSSQAEVAVRYIKRLLAIRTLTGDGGEKA